MNYALPPYSLFTCTSEDKLSFSHDVAIQNEIIDIFSSYGVEVAPADICHGMWKTRYEGTSNKSI